MQPPAETNYDIVVQTSVTLSANEVWNLGQKDLRYLNVWCDNVTCSNMVFYDNGMFVESFSGSSNGMRVMHVGGAPD